MLQIVTMLQSSSKGTYDVTIKCVYCYTLLHFEKYNTTFNVTLCYILLHFVTPNLLKIK